MAKLVVQIVAEEGDSQEELERLGSGGEPLLGLCLETVHDFDRHLRSTGSFEFKDGLADWEKKACQGLLYQMARGHIVKEKI